MRNALIHRVAFYVRANQITREIHTKDVLILTNVQLSNNHVLRLLSAKMQIPATIVGVRKAMLLGQIQKLLVNKSTWIFCVRVTSTAQQMPSALKVNASVKMALNHRALSVWISMNVARIRIFVAKMQIAVSIAFFSFKLYIDHLAFVFQLIFYLL